MVIYTLSKPSDTVYSVTRQTDRQTQQHVTMTSCVDTVVYTSCITNASAASAVCPMSMW